MLLVIQTNHLHKTTSVLVFALCQLQCAPSYSVLSCLCSKVYLGLIFFIIILNYPLPAWSLVLGRSHSSPLQPIFHYLVGFHLTLSIHLQVVIHPADLMPLNTSLHNLRK